MFVNTRKWTLPAAVLVLWATAFPGAVRADDPYVVVLGIAQDGGWPQAGCQRPCCRQLAARPELASGPACIAIVDPDTSQRWLVECTPAFPEQLARLNELARVEARAPGLDGILLTHAHIGHYAGLIHLGREVLGSRGVPVYAMPRMGQFLRDNGPWSQLVELNNIELRDLQPGVSVELNSRIRVEPILVPHRDEFSETVAFRIEGPVSSCLFLPDIDKWERWERAIEDELARVDVAWLDATFYDESELPGRDMSEIPHPLIVETLLRLQSLDAASRSKVRLIHLNHSNPALNPESAAAETVRRAGLQIARIGDRFELQ